MSEKNTGGPAFLIWKRIPGIPHIEVSNHGSIRTWIDRRKANPMLACPRDLKASNDGKGYRIICIRGDDGIKRTYRVCRLVLRAFTGEPTEGMQACHGNNVKHDDRLENLRWDTVSGNTLDQVKHGVHRGLKSNGEKHPLHKLNLDQVLEIKSLICDGVSTTEIASCFNVPRTTVNSIKIGRSWKMADAMLRAREAS